MESPKPLPDCGMGGVVEEAGSGLSEAALEGCGEVSLPFEVGTGSGEMGEPSVGEGSDDIGAWSFCLSTLMGNDGVSETPVA